jgi:hypothetical protein
MSYWDLFDFRGARARPVSCAPVESRAPQINPASLELLLEAKLLSSNWLQIENDELCKRECERRDTEAHRFALKFSDPRWQTPQSEDDQ